MVLMCINGVLKITFMQILRDITSKVARKKAVIMRLENSGSLLNYALYWAQQHELNLKFIFYLP